MFKQGSVALVTGAATGIGRACAEAFAAAGCTVVLADRDADRGQQAARELDALRVKTLFVQTDVSDADQVRHLHERIMTTFGRLDAACNNAGIEGASGPLAEQGVENFDQVIAVNLRSVFLCMREQIPLMLKSGGGAIVNMASVAGLVGFAGSAAYCASKGGVVQITRTAALDYAEQGIRVNAVCPGVIATEMIERFTGGSDQAATQMAAMHPMNRMGVPREISDTVVWLCSSQASFVTGQALAVDGGLVAR